MNIAAAIPPQPQATPASETVSCPSRENVGLTDFATALEVAAGKTASPDGNGCESESQQETEQPLNLEQAMQLMSMQIGLTQPVLEDKPVEQPVAQTEKTGPLEAITPAVQTFVVPAEQERVHASPRKTAGEPVLQPETASEDTAVDTTLQQAFAALETGQTDQAVTAAAPIIKETVKTDMKTNQGRPEVSAIQANKPDPAQNAAVSAEIPAVQSEKATSSATTKNSQDSESENNPDRSAPPSWAAAWQNAKPADHSNSVLEVAAAAPQNIQNTEGIDVVRQVIDQADISWQDGDQVIEIKLKPDEFGEVQIRLVKSETGLSAQIRTDNSETSRLLASQVAGLQDALQGKGLAITQIDIQYNAAGSDLASRQQSQSGKSERQNLPRRAGISRSSGLSAAAEAAWAGDSPGRNGKLDYLA